MDAEDTWETMNHELSLAESYTEKARELYWRAIGVSDPVIKNMLIANAKEYSDWATFYERVA